MTSPPAAATAATDSIGSRQWVVERGDYDRNESSAGAPGYMTGMEAVSDPRPQEAGPAVSAVSDAIEMAMEALMFVAGVGGRADLALGT